MQSAFVKKRDRRTKRGASYPFCAYQALGAV